MAPVSFRNVVVITGGDELVYMQGPVSNGQASMPVFSARFDLLELAQVRPPAAMLRRTGLIELGVESRLWPRKRGAVVLRCLAFGMGRAVVTYTCSASGPHRGLAFAHLKHHHLRVRGPAWIDLQPLGARRGLLADLEVGRPDVMM